jgi:hypothetical protein
MLMPASAKATALAALLILGGCADSRSQSVQSDLTIYLDGDMLAKGGVVFVHPLPVSQERWNGIRAEDNRTLPPPDDLKPIAEGGKRFTTTVTGQAVHLQFLYPEGERRYTFRFRPVPGSAEVEGGGAVSTRLLSIGGIDSDTGKGQTMEFGFIGLHDVGDQTIQVARKGADHYVARALVSAIEHPQPGEKEHPNCAMKSAIALCGYDAEQWSRLAARWEQNRQESEWDRRAYPLFNACHRDAERQGRTGGLCILKSVKGADPIVYEYRDKDR